MVIDTAKLDRGFYAVDRDGALYSVVLPFGGFNGIADTIELKPIHCSNADRIRAMTDEELAEWYYTEFFGQVPYCQEDCPEHNDCPTCLLDWLRQEASDD